MRCLGTYLTMARLWVTLGLLPSGQGLKSNADTSAKSSQHMRSHLAFAVGLGFHMLNLPTTNKGADRPFPFG